MQPTPWFCPPATPRLSTRMESYRLMNSHREGVVIGPVQHKENNREVR